MFSFAIIFRLYICCICFVFEADFSFSCVYLSVDRSDARSAFVPVLYHDSLNSFICDGEAIDFAWFHFRCVIVFPSRSNIEIFKKTKKKNQIRRKWKNGRNKKKLSTIKLNFNRRLSSIEYNWELFHFDTINIWFNVNSSA